ncbi:hypothetical protein BC833DRAFT_626785 [Globomyces pollinis-pini]|nr:hypothetical protein BC833DRAFT_626785 [Globomyces pollinis-pini]
MKLIITSLFNLVQFRLIGGQFTQIIVYQFQPVLTTFDGILKSEFADKFEVDLEMVRNLHAEGYSMLFLACPAKDYHSGAIIEYHYPTGLCLKINEVEVPISNIGTSIPINLLEQTTTILYSFDSCDMNFQKGFVACIRLVKRIDKTTDDKLYHNSFTIIPPQKDNHIVFKKGSDWSKTGVHPVELFSDNDLDKIYHRYGYLIHYSEYYEILDIFKIQTSKQIVQLNGWYQTDPRVKEADMLQRNAFWKLIKKLEMHSLKVKDQLLNEDLEEFNPSIAMKMAVAESLTRNSQLFLPLQANEIQQREKYYEVPRTEKEKRSWRSRNAKSDIFFF